MTVAEQEDRRRERWNRMNAGRWQKKKEGRSRPARTGRDKRLWGEPEIKEDLETGRTAFCFFSWVTVCVWRATTDPPWAHFTAQASINYQTSTLDIDRRLGCCAAGANATASGDGLLSQDLTQVSGLHKLETIHPKYGPYRPHGFAIN